VARRDASRPSGGAPRPVDRSLTRFPDSSTIKGLGLRRDVGVV
jgi:hypothetical protein